MSALDNDWNEYRLMIIDWHQQDIKEKADIRNRLEANQLMVTNQLTQIQTTLAEMQGRYGKKQARLNLVVPALVAFFVVLVEQAVAAWIK